MLLAAAVDGDISSSRYKESLGWFWPAHVEAPTALDELVDLLVGATEVTARELSIGGSSYSPAQGSQHYWHEVVWGMPEEGSAQTREWTYACGYSPKPFRGTPFAGLAGRLRKRLDHPSGSVGRACALILATTAALWPSTPPSMRAIAIRTILEGLNGRPESAEPIVALGIGAAHLLRRTPGWRTPYREVR